MGHNMPDSDAELWRRACSHDGQAFGQIYDRHRQAVFRHCQRRLESVAAAEDLVSMTFLEAWRKRGRVDLTTDSVLPWLLSLANYLIANYHRAAHRYRKFLARLPPAEDEPSAEAEAVASLSRIERASVVNGILDGLPVTDQQVLRLCDIEGLPREVVAKKLGLPLSTVKSRLARARGRARIAVSDSTSTEEASKGMNR
ncbi:RNA polymerase sigma factor [Nakamurella antarctica]|nr:sigma-70 family RNA polymerase sigma factor [Nakamurella antarctica]